MNDTHPMRRQTDAGWLCWLALRAAEFWDFVDSRMIVRRVLTTAILLQTFSIVAWSMGYVEAHPELSGAETALKISAVILPFTALQAAALKWYFESREDKK